MLHLAKLMSYRAHAGDAAGPELCCKTQPLQAAWCPQAQEVMFWPLTLLTACCCLKEHQLPSTYLLQGQLSEEPQQSSNFKNGHQNVLQPLLLLFPGTSKCYHSLKNSDAVILLKSSQNSEFLLIPQIPYNSQVQKYFFLKTAYQRSEIRSVVELGLTYSRHSWNAVSLK